MSKLDVKNLKIHRVKVNTETVFRVPGVEYYLFDRGIFKIERTILTLIFYIPNKSSFHMNRRT